MGYVQLVYSSNSNENIKEKDIVSIQQNSQKFNDENDITGCLVFFNHGFVGILEGEEAEVKKLFYRIKKDPGLINVRSLSSRPTGQRHFEGWNMVFQTAFVNGEMGMAARLFKQNLIGLAQLVEKPTYATEVFWYQVRKLLEDD